MNLNHGSNNPLGAPHRDHKPRFFSQIHAPAFQIAGIAIAFFLFLIIYFLMRRYFTASFPLLLTGISFLFFLLPGAALSYWFIPEQSIFERLGTAFTFSIGLMVLPCLLVMIVHLNLVVLLWIFVFMEVCAVLAFILLVKRRTKKQGARDDDVLHPLYIFVIAGFAVALCIISLQVPLIGDDWQGIPFLQNYLVTDHINLTEVFHGTNYPPTTRSEFGVWGLDFALQIKMSGLDAITHYHFLRPFMFLVALSAFYFLGRKIFARSNTAAFMTILFMIIVLVTISWGDMGYDLIARINQDKFALRYIILPVALGFFISYFKSHQLRELIFFGLTCWAAGGTHPLGPVLIGLPCLGFGLIHLVLEHNWDAFKRLVVAAICLIIGLVLPLIQLLTVSEDWLAFDLQGTLDPNLLTRLSMATSAEHLLLLPNGNYALHPAVFLDPLILISLLGIPYLLALSRKSIPARLLLGTLILVPAVLYYPPTGNLIGRLVTPWLLYRLAWSIPLASVLTIGWCIWDGGAWIFQHLFKVKDVRTLTVLPLTTLVLLLLLFSPAIKRGQAYLADVRQDPTKAQCQDVAPLLVQLSQRLESNSVILANHDLNFCIPAFSPYAKVIEYRWTATISRFPVEHRDEAVQRLKDILYYSSAHYVDRELTDILDRYDVRYVLIQQGEPLAIQLKHLPGWFEPVLQDDKFVLYQIMDRSTTLPIITANTYLMQNDWNNAIAVYSSLSGQDADTSTLAHIGLAQAYLSQGFIEESIDELSVALNTAPSDELVWELLAGTQVAAGHYDEAIVAYNKSIQLAPNYPSLLLELGHTYLLTGQTQEAETVYKKSIDLIAPEGSARWYRLLGDQYALAGWNTKALDAYRQSLVVLPGDISIEIAIGDVYLRNGDLDLARSAYEKANRIDRFAAEPISRLGILAEKSGNLMEAIQRYQQAVRLKPVSLTYYALLATAVRTDQSAEAALTTIQSLPGYLLTLPGPLLVSGTLYQSQGRYELAISEYEKAIERFPVDTGSLKAALGSLLATTSQWDAASANLHEALFMEPSIASDVFVELGKLQTNQAQLAEASGSFYQAIRNDPLNIGAYIEFGNEFDYQAKSDAALEMYQRAVSIQPNSLEGIMALGNFYLAHGNLDTSIESYRQVVALYPDELAGYLGLTTVYQLQGRLQEAMQVYDQANQVNMSSSPVLVLIAQGFRLNGDNDLALTQHLLAVDTDPNSLPALRALGFYLLSQNQTAEAEKTFRNAVQIEPTDGRNRVGLASVLLRLGSYDEALQQLQTAVESGDWKGNSYVALGNEYYRRGNLNEAVAAYQNAIALEPTLIDGYLQLGKTYEAMGNWDDAQAQYQEALKIAPASGAAYTAAGTALALRGEWAGAVETLESSIGVEPNYTEAYLQLGRVFIASGRATEAEMLYKQAIQRLPGSADIWMALSNFKYSQGQLDEALEAIQRAVDVEPGNMQAWLDLGSLYQMQGNFQETENSYLTAMKLLPGNADSYLALGDLYSLQGKVEDAQKLYEMAANVDQSQAQAYLNLGALHLSIGQIDVAIADFQQAIDREPFLLQGYLQLGNVYETQGDFIQAAIQYNKAIEIAPASADAFLALGNLNKKQGQWDASLRNYLQAVQIEPYKLDCWIGLGDFYAFRDNIQEAENAYLQAIAVNMGKADGYIRLGRLYQGLSQSDLALVYFRAAVSVAPGSISGHLSLGNFYQSQGDWDLAEQSFREAIRVAALPDGYLALGELFELRADNTAAEDLYLQALQISPADIRAYLALGELKEKQGDNLDSEILNQQAIAIAPTNPDGYVQLGNLYINSAKWDQALAELERGIIAAPGSANMHLALGDLYLRFQQFSTAREQFEIAASLDHTLPDPFISIADLYLHEGDRDNAIGILQNAVNSVPTQLDVYTALGQTYWIMGDSVNSLSAYAQGIQNSLNIPEAYIARADAYTIQGNWVQAQADLEAAWHLNPKSQDIGIRLANFLANQGDFEQALAILNQLKILANATNQVYTALGNLYSIQADWGASREAFENAIDLGGEITDAYAGLARIDEMQGKPEEAIRRYREAVETSPQDPQAWINLGDAFQARLNRLDAKHAYERAQQIDPQNMIVYIKLDQLNWAIEGSGIDLTPLITLAETIPSVEVYTTIAYLYQQRGDLLISQSWYEEATHIDPYNSDSWLALGDYYRLTNQWDQALYVYNQALKLEPYSPDVNTSIGFVQEVLNQTDAALESYQKAVAAAPLAWESQYTLANLLMELSRSSEAVSLASQWTAAAPGIEQEYIILGAIYTGMGETDLALQTYQSGLDLIPGSATLYVALGNFHRDRVLEITTNLEDSEALYHWAELLLGNFQESIDYLNSSLGWRLPENHQNKIYEVLNIYLGAVSLMQSAQLAYGSISSQADDAVAAYQQAVRLQPANSLAYVGLGQVKDALGESQEALAYYQEAVNTDPVSSVALFFLGNAYFEFSLPQEALPLFQTAILHDPEMIPAQIGLYKVYQSLDTLEPSQAAAAIEHGQYTWELLIDYQRISDGN